MLESLDLGYNHLNSGSLPTEIGQLVHLQWLSLRKYGTSRSDIVGSYFLDIGLTSCFCL